VSSYLLIKVVHVLAAFGLVGPLMLAPKWLHLARHDSGRSALRDLHRLTGISGWLVLISGGIMLYLQDGGMFFSLWMQFSIAAFIIVQIFDHFWADRREDEIEHNPDTSTTQLKIWLTTKLTVYFVMAILMIIKP
jgi:uncharacterized iron-regulated membrane protein